MFAMLILLLNAIGILGNFVALFKLARNSSKSNFTMLLKFLMANNLIALMGVNTLFILKRSLSKYVIDTCSYWFCVCWIVLGFFGIYSGCIAVLMSIERYLAICHTFFHREHVTRDLIKNALIGLSFLAAVIAFLPFFGLGIYVDEDTKKCIRYGEGKTLLDLAYTILILCFGTLICIVIVSFNTLVIMGLLKHLRQKKEIVCSSALNIVNLTTTATQEPIEIKFSKLMVILSLVSVSSWIPKTICIVLSLSHLISTEHCLYRFSDVLFSLPFTLDPYIYVLSGKSLQLVWNTVLWTSCGRRTSPRKTKSIEGYDNTINYI